MTEYQPVSHAVFMSYSWAMTIIMFISAVLAMRTGLLWLRLYNKLSAVVLSYVLVFIPDIVIVITYLARGIYQLKIEALMTGDGDSWFCALGSFLTIAACIAFSVGVVCISYTILRVTQNNPLSPTAIIAWGVVGWVAGCLIALIFAANNLLGPYKDLYCLVNEKNYIPFGTTPMILAIAMCFALMVNNYFKAYRLVRKAERTYQNESEFAFAGKASRVILRNGIMVVGTFYISWFFIFLDAFITTAGGSVPSQLDVVASLMAKFQPVADSLILYSLLRKLGERYLDDQQTVTPAGEEGPHINDRKAIERYVLRPIKEEGIVLDGGAGGLSKTANDPKAMGASLA